MFPFVCRCLVILCVEEGLVIRHKNLCGQVGGGLVEIRNEEFVIYKMGIGGLAM